MKRLVLGIVATSLLLAPPAIAEDYDFDPFNLNADGSDLDLEVLFNMDVVSATKNSQKLREAPAIIEVITDRDIRERGYRSVAEALRAVPGFSLLYDYTNYNVGVRGINGGMRAWSRIVKVMIDNQPVALRMDSSNFLGPELIPMQVVKRIEIIRGPGSALYGADAFLGVINLVTKRGEDLAGGQLSTGVGSFAQGSVEAGFAYGQQTELLGQNLDLAVAASGAQADRSGLSVASTSPRQTTFQDKATGEPLLTTGDVTRPRALFLSLALGDETDGKLALTGSYQQGDSAGKFLDWSIEQKLLDSKNRLVVNNQFLRATYARALGESLAVNLGAALVNGGPTHEDQLDINNPNYLQIRKAGYAGVDVNGEVRYQLSERNSLTVGGDYSTTDQQLQSTYNLFTRDFGSKSAGTVAPETEKGSKSFSNVGTFAQGILYPTEQLGITLGMRNDTHNVYGNVLNSRTGLVYLWNDAVSTKLLYGTSFKAPSPNQLYSAPIVFGDIIGNEALKPETAQTVETELSWILSKHLLASTNAYFTQVKDQVKIMQSGANYRAMNMGQASTVGIEGTLRWQLDSVKSYLNGSLQNTSLLQEHTTQTSFDSQDSRSELFPAVTVNAGVNLPLPWLPAALNLETRFVGEMKASESNILRKSRTVYDIPASLVVDAGLLSQDLTIFDRPADLSVKISNLFDVPVIYPGFSGIDIPGEGRAVTLRFVQHF